ncbi:hypothetical protein CYMTET_30602 [Cymbomonas tetramitiformis]|uniref:Uncharacterized protein n=1 Tax=Cymbomonas tetramitiformis TaxID=36881 RepID=A0AAE0FIH1_9CHLO|nr:hypothetical protein CYMTET_30602 [Cymbomonas tetramitiformis]
MQRRLKALDELLMKQEMLLERANGAFVALNTELSSMHENAKAMLLELQGVPTAHLGTSERLTLSFVEENMQTIEKDSRVILSATEELIEKCGGACVAQN